MTDETKDRSKVCAEVTDESPAPAQKMTDEGYVIFTKLPPIDFATFYYEFKAKWEEEKIKERLEKSSLGRELL